MPDGWEPEDTTATNKPVPAVAAAGAGPIPRPRLFARLQEGLARRLTIVSGPAGYGKTTAVGQWLCREDIPVAWLTLSPLDNEPMTFLSGLVAAIKQPYPGQAARAGSLVAQPMGAPTHVLADFLLEDLADLPGPLILTLDEFHQISNADILTFIERLVQFLPTHVHLVLISRTAPSLPLELMRARGDLSELRVADLRLDEDEVRQFLVSAAGAPVDGAAAAQLARMTEGWAGGLQLALLARRPDESIESLAARLGQGEQPFAADFLLDEVLSRQSPDTQRFLLHTSILEHLNDALCAAAMGDGASVPVLAHLVRSILLIMPTEDRPDWYRYHPLFRDLLRSRLEATEDAATIRALHRRAGDWYAAAGRLDEAIGHLLAADDPVAAAVLVEENFHPALNREELWRVTRWMALLPDAMRHRPRLLIARAWVYILEMRAEAVGRLLDELRQTLPMSNIPAAEQAQIQGQIDLISAYVAYLRGKPDEAVELTDRGLDSVPAEMVYARSQGIFIALSSRYAHGGLSAAEGAFRRLIGQEPDLTPVLLGRALIARGMIHVEAGDLQSVLHITRSLEQIAERSGLTLSRGWADYGRGIVAYEWNDLSEAEQYLQHAVDQRYRLHSRAVVESYVLLVKTLVALGNPARAADEATNLRRYVVESGNHHFMPHVEAAEMQLSEEHLRASTADLIPPPTVDTCRRELLAALISSRTLIRVRGLLLWPTPERLENAAAHLAAMHEATRSVRTVRRQVEALTLSAMVHDASGCEDAAFEALRTALQMAEPGRLTRTLIDCGPGLEPLLRRLAATGERSPTLERLLGAMDAGQPQAEDGAAAAIEALRETLTPRELQILQMLAGYLTNQEIAAALFISPESVRRYTTRLYRKLGVRNRRAAVRHAEALGLLASDR